MREENLVDLPSDYKIDTNIHRSLVRAGFIESLLVDIQRTIYQVTDDTKSIAAIKLDDVTFSFGSKRSSHREIEVSTDDADKTSDLRAIAYSLVSRLGVQPTGSPKYVIGVSRTRDELANLVENSDLIRIYTRRDSVEPRYSKQDISLLQNELRNERAKVAAKIKHDAKIQVRNRILAILAIIWLTSFLVLIIVPWDSIEPWTWFIPLTITFVSYGYFVLREKALNPFSMYERFVNRVEERTLNEFDSQFYKRRLTELAADAKRG